MIVTAFDIKKALAEKHRGDFFLTEVKNGSTYFPAADGLKILDGLAIKKSWTNPCFTGYEVKISRGDFMRDAKFYTYEELVNCLYIVCPKGMIDRTELPDSIGLMYYDPEKKTITTRKKAIYRKIEYSPEMLLYIIYTRLDSDRIPFFSDKAEYFREYLAGKRDNRQLGVDVSSELVKENQRMERELAELGVFKHEYENHKAIQKVLQKHQIYGWRSGGIAEELDKVLCRRPTEGVVEVRKSLERIVDRMKRMEKTEEEGQ